LVHVHSYTLLLVRTPYYWLQCVHYGYGSHGQLYARALMGRPTLPELGPGARGQGSGARGQLGPTLSEQALVRVANQPCHPSLQPDRDDTASARDDGHGHIDQRFQARKAKEEENSPLEQRVHGVTQQ